jgi:hypothetical protein
MMEILYVPVSIGTGTVKFPELSSGAVTAVPVDF